MREVHRQRGREVVIHPASDVLHQGRRGRQQRDCGHGCRVRRLRRITCGIERNDDVVVGGPGGQSCVHVRGLGCRPNLAAIAEHAVSRDADAVGRRRPDECDLGRCRARGSETGWCRRWLRIGHCHAAGIRVRAQIASRVDGAHTVGVGKPHRHRRVGERRRRRGAQLREARATRPLTSFDEVPSDRNVVARSRPAQVNLAAGTWRDETARRCRRLKVRTGAVQDEGDRIDRAW